MLARLALWKRVVFLDDDITVPEAADLERAAALLGDYAGLGLRYTCGISAGMSGPCST